MAKGGAFGNPLTTGIALNFEVDMTPYRQMMQDNLKFAQTQAAERKAKEKEFQDILKNITLDTSKIHERYKKDAMSEYASTINDAMSMHKAGDISSMYKRMGKYTADMNSYVASTQDFNNYKKSKGDKTFRNDAAIAAMDNVEGVSNEQLMKDYQNDVGYSNGLFNFTVIDRPDVVGYGNKVLQGVDKEYVRDAAGEIVASETFGPKGTRLYETSVPESENFIKETSAWLLGSAGGSRLLMDKYGLTPDKFDEVDPTTGRQRLDLAAEDYIRNTFSPKLYGEKEKDPYKPSTAEYKGWSFSGGGAKSPNWEVNKVSNIPVSLTDEAGGSLSGWKVDYIKQEGVSEIERNIELGKGSYFAEGGSKIQKVSDAASGLGKIVKGTPAGVYVRDDKKGGQLWVAYETSYIPPTDKLMEGFERYYDPNKKDNNGNIITKDEQKQAFMATRVSEDKDLISKTTKRIVYVPIRSDSEKIEFRTTMGMSSDDFNKLTDMIGFSSKSGSSSNVTTQAEFDAAWAKLKPGEKITSPDGTTVYTK
jgi:hypothetical protein